MKNVARTDVRLLKNKRDMNTRKARALKSRRRLTIVLLLAVAATTIAFASVSSAKFKTNSSRATKTTKPKSSTEERERLVETSGENDLESVKTVQATAGMPGFDQKPKELHLTKSGRQFNGDLRNLPKTKPADMERPEHEGPEERPLFYVPPKGTMPLAPASQPKLVPAAPAPTPLVSFNGLGRPPGNGFPPDTNGDVGPSHYIQTINTSIGIFDKATGLPITSFSFNTFMSQGAFGNLCDTNNFGDPVVVYDTFEDRWVITDFAFTLDGSNNVINPPGSFQCFAVSKTGDPVVGGWNFYSIQITDALNDYPKFGIWPDGLYMTANMFGFGGLSGSFVISREWAFNKAQMYAGAASPQIVTIDAPRLDINGGTVFTAIPSNARLQNGTPPAGTPNYFAVTGTYTNALQIWKFHVDWSNVYASSFTGPFIPLTGSTWIGPPGTVPSQGGNNLDTLATRAMMQNQYSNFGGAESIWLTHTVRNSTTAGVAAVRWYEVSVTGGTVAANTTQAANHEPDTTNRFMPSLAVDRVGDMLVGYSASSAAMKPAIRYAGRLPGDPLSTLPQTETDLIQGLGTQLGNCGGATCTRWGDYSAMSLDPNGCTFWFTSEYYAVDGLNYLTRIGSIAFPSCTPIGNGTVQGTVTTSPGGTPISGATVAFGSRTATTNGSGFYSFTNIPAGTYPSITASNPGSNSSTSTPVVVPDAGTAVKDFALTAAAASACLTDTSQADFSLGTPTAVDLVTAPGDAILQTRNLDQINEAVGNSGTVTSTTFWFGQTFIPSVTGLLTRADLAMFCAGCTGTSSPFLLSVRATSGGLPTGPDLATTGIPSFLSGSIIFYSGTFSTPALLTAGTKYALIIHPTAVPSPGNYAISRTGSSTTGQSLYANGDRVSSADSGGSWAITTTGGIATDCGFRTFMTAPAGNLVSGIKDSNPVSPLFTRWNSLAWTATVPANTTLQFQIAGSNNANGPFNFIGPDGTAATFFTTSPAAIFNLVNGNRYLKYKAYFTTTDGSVTPTVNDVTACFTTGPTAADGIVTGRIIDQSGAAVAGVVVTLSGTQNRKFITDASGNYRFDNVETNGFYTVTPSLVNYHFGPESRSFSLLANMTDAVFTATRDAVITGNAIDMPEYFVRQHYLDFLGREPDESGFNFWSDQIRSCGADMGCIERRTINVSAAYFLSIEFGKTGGFVDGLYRASYGRAPRFAEFMPDTATVARDVVVGTAGWPEHLAANKQAFLDAWVHRPDFRVAYDGLTNAAYVDRLISNTRVAFGDVEREALVSGLNTGSMTRSTVLQQISEDDRFLSAKRNEMFVMMEYFGYLRRDPDESGYRFWLNKLNQFGGNFEQAEMVKAFIVSGEYRQHFIP
jgi:hypothetical protein